MPLSFWQTEVQIQAAVKEAASVAVMLPHYGVTLCHTME